MVKSGYRGVVPFVMHQFCEPGEAWSGTFDHYLFSITLEGGADYRLPEGEAQVRVGDMLCFAPGAWQNWVAIQPDGWTVYYVITDLPPALQDLLPMDTIADGISQVHLPPPFGEHASEAFAEMVTWGGRRTAMSERLILNKLEYVLLLIRNLNPIEMTDARVERARTFLHDRIEMPTTLDDIARVACLSKSRLCALFKETTGRAPLQYLEGLRMDRAAQWLQFSSLSVGDIAEKLCFSDRKYFDKRFKRYWQLTPFRYRRQSAQH